MKVACKVVPTKFTPFELVIHIESLEEFMVLDYMFAFTSSIPENLYGNDGEEYIQKQLLSTLLLQINKKLQEERL